MTKGNDGRFRIQLTPDIVGENNSFKFTLDNPNEGEKNGCRVEWIYLSLRIMAQISI